MIDLYDYRFKHVKITDIDGRVHIGFVEYYTPAINDPDDTENIAIKPPNSEGFVVGFTAAEIAKIEIIEPAENLNIPKLQPAKELQPA